MFNTNALMTIAKNQDAGTPESMQVVKQGEWFLVQTLWEKENGPNVWVTQAEWKDARVAMQDCSNWYLSGEKINFGS